MALSITKSQLAKLTVGIPALDTQRQIAKLAAAAFEEEQLLYQLIHNRKRQLTALGDRVLNP